MAHSMERNKIKIKIHTNKTHSHTFINNAIIEIRCEYERNIKWNLADTGYGTENVPK